MVSQTKSNGTSTVWYYEGSESFSSECNLYLKSDILVGSTAALGSSIHFDCQCHRYGSTFFRKCKLLGSILLAYTRTWA